MCIDEGIDELAEFCGAGKAVAEWTARFDYSNGFLYFFERGFMFLNFFGISFVIFDLCVEFSQSNGWFRSV